MAGNTRAGASTRNAMLDTINTTLGADPLLRIYDGAQPATPDTALGAQNMLAELACATDAFLAAAAGVLTADAIASDTNAAATGTAAWASFCTAAGVRKIDCSVGTADANVIINTTTITSGGTVSCSAATITLPMQGS